MDYGFDLFTASGGAYGRDNGGMVVGRCLVEGPQVLFETDIGAPILQPDVVTVV